jgi:hypothetical protein
MSSYFVRKAAGKKGRNADSSRREARAWRRRKRRSQDLSVRQKVAMKLGVAKLEETPSSRPEAGPTMEEEEEAAAAHEAPHASHSPRAPRCLQPTASVHLSFAACVFPTRTHMSREQFSRSSREAVRGAAAGKPSRRAARGKQQANGMARHSRIPSLRSRRQRRTWRTSRRSRRRGARSRCAGTGETRMNRSLSSLTRDNSNADTRIRVSRGTRHRCPSNNEPITCRVTHRLCWVTSSSKATTVDNTSSSLVDLSKPLPSRRRRPPVDPRPLFC